MGVCKIIAVSFLVTAVFFESLRGDDVGLPCQYVSENCQTVLEKVADEKDKELIVLEVSCQCKYSKDVSKNLKTLYPIMCPLIPEAGEESKIDKAIFRIDNCDIIEEGFPFGMIEVLRRAKEFHINVTNVSHLRLPSSKTYEMEETPKIEASFKDSNISGLGVGWVSHASQLNLVIENSNVSILEKRFISNNNDKESIASIKILTSKITTINSFAFILPDNCSLQILGSRIGQIESEAISGGHSVSFESSIIGNMQTHSVSLFGLLTFLMHGCTVARIEREAIMEENTRRSVPRIHQKYSSENVNIIGNKFIEISNGSFELLCREKNLTFQHNFFNNISSTLLLKSKHCAITRDWWTTLSNNGFNCSNYDRFLSGQIDEQVCAVYETGWCLCSAHTHDKDNAGLCKEPMRNFLEEKYSSSPHFIKYNLQCESYKTMVPQEVKEEWSTFTSATSRTTKEVTLSGVLAVVLSSYLVSRQLG